EIGLLLPLVHRFHDCLARLEPLLVDEDLNAGGAETRHQPVEHPASLLAAVADEDGPRHRTPRLQIASHCGRPASTRETTLLPAKTTAFGRVTPRASSDPAIRLPR